MDKDTVEHNYFGKKLIMHKKWYVITITYKDKIIYKRYFNLILTIVPSVIFPDEFCSYDDRVIRQIVNEVFDGAL